MCGGVGYKTRNIPEEELKKYYSPELIKRFKRQGRIESFFWFENASLPVKRKGKTQVLLWGNKDREKRLPATGWARQESLKNGKWDYLKPEEVDIPVEQGYEKKTWFDFKKGTKGVVVKRGGDERVYMITKDASHDYQKETGHNREPLGEKDNYEHELGKQDSLI